MRWSSFLAVATLVLVGSSTAQAKSKWKSRGQLALESRVFSNDNDPDTADVGVGLFGRLELQHKHKPFKERFRAYGRVDQQDSGRAIFVVEEGWAEWDGGDLELRLGIDLFNWSATEAFHPADIINARNIDSDAENYEKLGEPTAMLSYKLGQGSIKAMFMPFYSEPILPSRRSRLNFLPPSFNPEEAQFLRLNSAGDFTGDSWGPQGAVRFTQTVGDIDFGLHVVHHIDREQPEAVIDLATGELFPLFRAVTQIGGTYQHVVEDFVFKLETGYRIFVSPAEANNGYSPVQDRDHLRLAVGAEYGMVNDDSVEQTFILEAQSIFGVPEETRKALQVFQRDLLLGYRIALGDIDSTELMVSAIVDLEIPENVFFNASFKQRFLETWSMSVAARMVFAPEGFGSGGFVIPGDSSHIRVFLTRYF